MRLEQKNTLPQYIKALHESPSYFPAVGMYRNCLVVWKKYEPHTLNIRALFRCEGVNIRGDVGGFWQ